VGVGARREFAALFADPSVPRRRFLGLGIGGSLLLAAGAVLPSGCRRYPSPRERLVYLNSMEYAVVNAAASEILGLEAEEVQKVDVGVFVDRFIADFDRDVRRQVRLMLRVFEHGTHVFDLKRVGFTGLSPAERSRYVDGWMDSTIGARRVVFRALKALCALGYYSQAQSWSGVGYDGPWLGRIPIEPAASALELAPWHELARDGELSGPGPRTDSR
jgi:hypothetical protein